MTNLHDSLTVIDGLVISKWSRAVFADIHKGGLTAANCTCLIWEGFVNTSRRCNLKWMLLQMQQRTVIDTTRSGRGAST